MEGSTMGPWFLETRDWIDGWVIRSCEIQHLEKLRCLFIFIVIICCFLGHSFTPDFVGGYVVT